VTVDGRRRPSYVVRRARTADVAANRGLVDAYAASRILLSKEMVTLNEDVQEFWVADDPERGGVIGCGALHVMWEDLAEVRTLATGPSVDRSRRGECRAGAAVVGGR
jgi:N-acetylglutamate synthase-like GNAT family acetyltransferase